jgi:plasmid maintenance system antidote protein VapI
LDGFKSFSPVNEMEMTGAAVARRLNMSKSAVSHAVVRGEKIASDMKLKLSEAN